MKNLSKYIHFFFQTGGYIVEGSVKFQVNALLEDLSGISEAEKFSNMILPLAWAEFVSIIYGSILCRSFFPI